MQVDRNTPIAQIKKIYRLMSKNLHPDKNKSETAADEFRVVAHAFDVLTDKDKRREYDRLGDAGVNALENSVVDHKFILSHMIVHYLSSLVFAFLLNMSDKGEAFGIACAALASIFVLEICLKLHEWSLPSWFFPQNTPHEVIATLHRIYSPFMHGVRCVLAVTTVDRKLVRETALESLSKATVDLSVRVESIFYRVLDYLDSKQNIIEMIDESTNTSEEYSDDDRQRENHSQVFVSPLHVPAVADSMETMLRFTEKMVEKNRSKEEVVIKEVEERLIKSRAIINNSKGDNSGWLLLRNLAIYLVARYIFIKE